MIALGNTIPDASDNCVGASRSTSSRSKSMTRRIHFQLADVDPHLHAGTRPKGFNFSVNTQEKK